MFIVTEYAALNEMFGEIIPEIGDLTPDGVCVCLCVSSNSHQRLRSYGASAKA